MEGGAPVSVAQAMLRHADPRITLGIYSHVVGNSQRHAVEKLAAILRPNAPKLKPDGKWIQVRWGERWDLNPRPSVPQTDALPAELRSPPLKKPVFYGLFRGFCLEVRLRGTQLGTQNQIGTHCLLKSLGTDHLCTNLRL